MKDIKLPGKPNSENLFPRVREAREALRQKALDLYNKYIELIDKAMAEGDFKSAERALRFLTEHMPAADDGTRMIDPSVNKPSEQKQLGTTVNIGFAIGGVGKPAKELEAATVDAEVETTDE